MGLLLLHSTSELGASCASASRSASYFRNFSAAPSIAHQQQQRVSPRALDLRASFHRSLPSARRRAELHRSEGRAAWHGFGAGGARAQPWRVPYAKEAGRGTAGHLRLLMDAAKNASFCHNCRTRLPRVGALACLSSTAGNIGGGGGRGIGGWGGAGGGGGGEGDGFEARASSGAAAVGGEQSDELPVGGESGDNLIVLEVGGMSCGGCSASVKRILESQPQVSLANVNLATETAFVQVSHDGEAQNEWPTVKAEIGKVLAEHLTSCGFKSTVRDRDEKPSFLRKRDERMARLKDSGRRLAVAWTLATVCIVGHASHFVTHMLPSWTHFLHSNTFNMVLSLVALAGPGRKLLVDGWQSFKRGSPNMNTLVGLGAVSSFAVSTAAAFLPKLGWQAFFEEPVMLLAFVLLGRAVEERAKIQATSDMTSLLNFLPTKARLITNASNGSSPTMEIPCESLGVGDSVLVLPGSTEFRGVKLPAISHFLRVAESANYYGKLLAARLAYQDRIPVDGVVRGGRSTVDESSLTGEPLPILKELGDEVNAGTINYNGTLTVEAKRPGGDTVLGDIVRMVEDAQTREAPVQRFVDKVAGKFCYGVMALSGATFAFWSTLGPHVFPAVVASEQAVLLGLQLACNVLVRFDLPCVTDLAHQRQVIACPCALGLATPTAVLVGTSLGARNGLLIRGGDILEKVSLIDSIVFDKTGTLTLGRPVVTSVVPNNVHNGSLPGEPKCSTWSETELLALASAVERNTSHPIARALVNAASAAGCRYANVKDGSFDQEPGSGAMAVVEGKRVTVGSLEWLQRHGASGNLPENGEVPTKGETVIYIGVDGYLGGTVSMVDDVRNEAAATISALHKMGVKTSMLSGDKQWAANSVAARIGIPEDQVHAGVTPEGKVEYVKQLQKNGTVAMVGDGVNDAAALAEADVGIAMAGGVGAASEVASIVLMGDKLTQVVDALELSRLTLQKIKQNLWWAFMYNIVGLPVAAGALLPLTNTMLTPSLAGALMGISSIGVMVNSLLLQVGFNKLSIADGKGPRNSVAGHLQKSGGVPEGDAHSGRDEKSTVGSWNADRDLEKGLLSQEQGRYSH